MATISCTDKATVRVNAKLSSGSDLVTLRADGSLKSQLKANGINGVTGTTVSVPGSSGENHISVNGYVNKDSFFVTSYLFYFKTCSELFQMNTYN